MINNQVGPMKGMNLLRDGYEAVADQVARHIKAGRTNYTVHVKPSGAVLVAPLAGTRAGTRVGRERPAEWFVGTYGSAGMNTEVIEGDLLMRERELRAAEMIMAAPAGRRHYVPGRNTE